MKNPVASVQNENHDAKNQKWPISDDFWLRSQLIQKLLRFTPAAVLRTRGYFFYFFESPAYGEK